MYKTVQFPVGAIVDSESMCVGEEYYGLRNDLRHPAHLRGIFSGYWFNYNGYKMAHFHNAIFVDKYGSRLYGDFEAYNQGLFLRVCINDFEPWHYYRARMFSSSDKQSIKKHSVDWQTRYYYRIMLCIDLPMDINRIIVDYLVTST